MPYAGIEAPLKVIGENTPNQLGINLMIHANMEYTNLSKFLPSLYYGENYSVRPISLTLGTTKTTLASGKATNSEAHRIAFVSKGAITERVLLRSVL